MIAKEAPKNFISKKNCMEQAKEGFRRNFNSKSPIEDKVKDVVKFFLLIFGTFGQKVNELEEENR